MGLLPIPSSKPWTSEQDMPPEMGERLAHVRKRQSEMENARRPHLDKWNDYYGLYRNYRKLKMGVQSRGSQENDRDEVWQDAKRQWGAELFIPYCFATIETIVPRLLANDPKMLVKPKKAAAMGRTEPIAQLFDERQRQIRYSLKLQPTARRGLKYGLGVQKTFWEADRRKRKVNKPRMLGSGFAMAEEEYTKSEGPQVDDVDIFDFFWDPAAKDIPTCRDAIHRTWRSTEYVLDEIKAGRWYPVDEDAVKRMASDGASFSDDHDERLRRAGLDGHESTDQGNMHEVWEYWSGDEQITVLDKALVVQVRENPFYHGELPFQIFRPTPQEGEFVGIGAIEPIAHLQYELNALRSQRRDNATLVLQKAFLYREGSLATEDLTIGPGRGIGVYGNIRDTIQPLEFGEIPASGYSEEEAIKRDIERTTGMSDPVAGGEGSTPSSETATGIQLIQQAANVRIAQQTKNLEWETITPGAEQWLELWRQHTFNPRDVRLEDNQSPTGYTFTQVTPETLRLDVEVVPSAGSTEPENVPQKRNDAMVLYNQFNQNPAIDQAQLVKHTLQEFDVRDSEKWLVPPAKKIDPRILGELMQQEGMEENYVLGLIEQALKASNEVPRQEDMERPTDAVQEVPQGA